MLLFFFFVLAFLRRGGFMPLRLCMARFFLLASARVEALSSIVPLVECIILNPPGTFTILDI